MPATTPRPPSSEQVAGALLRSPASSGAISSRSSTTVTSADRPSSPVRCRSSTGTRSSPIPPSPTPSSIASSTTPTASPSRETACERSPPNAPILTYPRKPDPTPHAGNDTPAAFVGTGGWGLAPLTGEQRRDLLEVVDDRHQRGSTIITSQVPIEHWHEVIADPTIADAVLDRLVHNAHRLALKGDSMRKITAQRANLDVPKKT